MPNAARTEAELYRLFADNCFGEISAQDGRDLIATMFGLYRQNQIDIAKCNCLVNGGLVNITAPPPPNIVKELGVFFKVGTPGIANPLWGGLTGWVDVGDLILVLGVNVYQRIVSAHDGGLF